MAGKDGHRRSSVPAAGEVFAVGNGLAWIDSQSRYCTPERKRRVPDKWAGARLHRWRLRRQRHMMSGALPNRSPRHCMAAFGVLARCAGHYERRKCEGEGISPSCTVVQHGDGVDMTQARYACWPECTTSRLDPAPGSFYRQVAESARFIRKTPAERRRILWRDIIPVPAKSSVASGIANLRLPDEGTRRSTVVGFPGKGSQREPYCGS